MKIKPLATILSFFLLFTFSVSFAVAQESAGTISLPPPDTTGGRPLMQVLKDRHSSRSFGTQELSPATLSNLLWAAYGINRPENGHRTAPSAMNWQEVDIYVAMKTGLYRYDAQKHSLVLVVNEDIRSSTGTQDFPAKVPLNLVYVADLAKVKRSTDESRSLFTAADVGFISENVYLYCASEGLATVVRGSVDKPALAKKMKLRADQSIILAQSVGYPEK